MSSRSSQAVLIRIRPGGMCSWPGWTPRRSMVVSTPPRLVAWRTVRVARQTRSAASPSASSKLSIVRNGVVHPHGGRVSAQPSDQAPRGSSALALRLDRDQASAEELRPGASLIANAVTRTDRARRPRTAPAATTQLPITALTAPRVSCVVAPASLQFANSRLACARFTRLSAYAAPARSTAVPNDRCAREAIARMRLTGELSTAISIAKSDATDDASCSMNSQHVIQRPSCWYGPGARTPLGGTPNPRSARKAPPLPRGRATARRHHATPRYSSSLARQPERVWDVRARCCRRPAGQRPGNVRSGHLRPPVPRPMLARYRISGPCPHHARPPPNGTSDCPPRNRGPTAAPGGTGRCPAADFPTPLKLACANPVAQRTWSRPFCVSAGDVPRRLVGKTPASLCRPDWNPQRTVRHEH
jgi:hypothetical protein